jgi:hypothetical protein
MSELRTEIIEASKSRTEFLKWKLIGVSALGAAGIGLTEHSGTASAFVVLGLIPLVCFYVDLLCRHISLRILVIGRFLSLAGAGDETLYERFVAQSREARAFGFEDAALLYSTLILSALVIVMGFFAPAVGALPKTSVAVPILGPVSVIALVQWGFYLSGGAGAVLTALNHQSYVRRKLQLDRQTLPAPPAGAGGNAMVW